MLWLHLVLFLQSRANVYGYSCDFFDLCLLISPVLSLCCWSCLSISECVRLSTSRICKSPICQLLLMEVKSHGAILLLTSIHSAIHSRWGIKRFWLSILFPLRERKEFYSFFLMSVVEVLWFQSCEQVLLHLYLCCLQICLCSFYVSKLSCSGEVSSCHCCWSRILLSRAR